MTRKQSLLMILLALVTGLIGGALSSQLFTIQTVFADKKGKPLKVIEANEFRLVDVDGKVLGALKLEETLDDFPKPYTKLQDRYAGLWLYSRKGKTLIELSTNPWRSQNRFHMPIGTHLSLCNPNYGGAIELWTDPTNIAIEIKSSERMSTKITSNSIHLRDYSNTLSLGACLVRLMGKEPKIVLEDENGNERLVLGSMKLVVKKTGTKIMRSAASLVLLDEKGNVIWETPE